MANKKIAIVESYLNFKHEGRVCLTMNDGRKSYILTMEETLTLLSDLRQKIDSAQELVRQRQNEMAEAN